ncbi:MAG: 23S rRNA (guanosine(2251)-2'-O)-methyltransferase RlmB [Bacilli bacterium]|nr:23S rRNA (guanosine(2251)-2'-O)-methyltransferase RlmB [Bacilli bacterium]
MYIYGKNVVSEYLKENKKIKKAYVYTKFNDLEIINKLEEKKININYLEKYELDKKVNGMHQGVILDVEDFKYASIDDLLNKENAIILILDHIEDPHNFGAIIRTCEAANIDGIIIPKDRSVEVNSTVVKVSTGAIEHVSIVKVTNLSRTIDEMKQKGFWIIGTDMDGTSYDEIDYKGKIGIVIGNEGSGMSRIVKESCDFIASIPMLGTTNSLNASVATGIIIYEAIKSRK